MKKFIKELFSEKNINNAMMSLAFAQPYNSGSYYLYLNNIIRDNKKATNKEMKIKKVA